MELIKIVWIALTVLVACLLLRGMRESLSVGVRIGGIVLIFVLVMSGLEEVVSFALRLSDAAAFSSYATPMLRATGLAFLCKICSDICRDCGESGLANGVETAGKAGILLLALPMIRELMETASSLWRGAA